MQGTNKKKTFDHVTGPSDHVTGPSDHVTGPSDDHLSSDPDPLLTQRKVVKKATSNKVVKKSKVGDSVTVRRKGIRRQYRSLSDDVLGKRLVILEQRTLRAQDKFSRANDCWQKLLAEQRFRSPASPATLTVDHINDNLSEVGV
jgi:hypothetical protein